MNWFFAVLAIALALWFFALLYLKSYISQRTSLDYILGMIQDEVMELQADIDHKTEQSLQLLEDKIQTLREICNDVEQRITLYDRELAKREMEAKTIAALEKAKSNAVKSKTITKQTPFRQDTARPEPPKIVASREPLPPLKDRVAELFYAGLAPELIAKRLSLSLGEVNLYINLTKEPAKNKKL